MKRSNEPIFWLLFGAGGMVSALVFPIIGLLILGFSLDIIDGSIFSYAWMNQAVSSVWGKLIFLVLIIFPTWHSAHRMYHTLHDFKIHTGTIHKLFFYGLAALVTILAVAYVF